MANGSTMYQLLVQDPNDVLGALAYTAYKQHEVEVMSSIEAKTGHPPTAADLDAFHVAASAPAQLAMYQDRAEALSLAFVQAMIERRTLELQVEVHHSEVVRKVDKIIEKLDAKRTLGGWFSDALGNLAVTFVTILLVAAIAVGFRALEKATGWIGQTTGASEVAPHANTASGK